MNIENYNLDTHKHIFSAWAASRAASQSKNFKFTVALGSELLLLGESGNKTNVQSFIRYINQITKITSQKEYDQWHHLTIQNMRKNNKYLLRILKIHHKSYEYYSYGIAAKILNCYLKAFFLEHFGNHGFADFIHPPVDALLLGALRKEEKTLFDFTHPVFTNIGVQKIPTWTRINEHEYKAIIEQMKQFIASKNQKGLWKIEYFWVGHQ